MQFELEAIKEKLLSTVAEMGREHDYCADEMAVFVSRVLGIGENAAHLMLAPYLTKEFSITLSFKGSVDFDADEIPDSYWADVIADSGSVVEDLCVEWSER